MIRHVVMFQFAEEAEGRSAIENAQIAKERLLNLTNRLEFIRKMEVGINDAQADSRNYTICLTCDFDTMEDLKRYAGHPDHVEVADFIAKVKTGRVCVDYEI